MELKSGYKQSEIGIIPEDWEVKPLGECLISAPTYGINAPSVTYSSSLPTYIRITDIEDGRFAAQGRTSVNSPFWENYCLQVGDIVFARTGASVGKSYLYNKEDGVLVYAGFLIKASTDPKKIDAKYLSYCVTTGFYWNWVGTTSMRSGQPGINGKEYSQFLFPLPPLPEQRAIAAALGDVAALIVSLDALIAKKRDLKIAARSELLRPKEGWNKLKLGDLASFHKGKGLPKSELDSHGSELCVHYGELFLDYPERISTVQSRTNLTVGVFRSLSNDVLMPTSDVTPNGLAVASCIQQDGVILGGDILVIRTDKNEVNGEFLSHSIRSQKDQIMQLVTGTTVYHLYSADMKRFEFWMPKLEEQIAIAEVLSDMDAEIAALETKRDKTRDLKRGMMQELLTGRTRLMPTNSNSLT